MMHWDSVEHLDGWAQLCRRTVVKGLLEVRFAVVPPIIHRPAVFVEVTLSTVPRDGGRERIQVRMERAVHGEPDVRQLFALAREMYMHECAEMFECGGVRLYDPHTSEVTR